MQIHELSPAKGSVKKVKRIGRGHGSGWGKTAGKGHKGQKARSGSSKGAGFEGGQMPLQRRVPKRGFNNIFRKNIVAIRLSKLNVFENGDNVDTQAILDKGITKNAKDGIKIIGNDEFNKRLNIKVYAYSKSAKEKIEAAGGKAEVI